MKHRSSRHSAHFPARLWVVRVERVVQRVVPVEPHAECRPPEVRPEPVIPCDPVEPARPTQPDSLSILLWTFALVIACTVLVVVALTYWGAKV